MKQRRNPFLKNGKLVEIVGDRSKEYSLCPHIVVSREFFRTCPH